MTQHLFLFTIGPVQSFIAQARKTVDLKAGSDILSKLIKKAIALAQSQYQAEIIMPYAPAGGSSESMPNKFLAQVPIAASDCKNMGQTIQQAVVDELKSLADKAWQNMNIINGDATFREVFDEQIGQSLELYWVFEPLPDPGNYREAYANIEAKLSAIKNTRTFGQLPPDEDGRKCSVTGERDALVFNEKFHTQPNGRPPFARAQKTRLLRKSPVHLDSGEGLSAVVATKRFYNTRTSFHSTAGIASKAFLNQAEASLKFQLEEYRRQFDQDDWDEQLLYPENLTKDYFNKHLSKALPANITPELLRDKLRTLWVKGKELGLPTRTPYYALLSFDGDEMGKIWSGDPKLVSSNTDLKSFQKELAERLATFANKARIYLDGDLKKKAKGEEKEGQEKEKEKNYGNSRGQTVYAGGDDFTGFINLHYLYEVLQYLRTLFRNEVSNPMRQTPKDHNPNRPDGLIKEITFSAGICIAHYKTPLGEVVRNAQVAQDHAKDDAGRNAFCIHVMKRSGEGLRASMRWGTPEEMLQNWASLRTCVHYLQQGCFSNTFITSIATELRGLMGQQGDLPEAFQPMIEAELKRLIQRAKIEGGMKSYLAANPQETATSVEDNMQKAVLLLLRQSPKLQRLRNALNLLQIADFLNRQPDHAN